LKNARRIGLAGTLTCSGSCLNRCCGRSTGFYSP